MIKSVGVEAGVNTVVAITTVVEVPGATVGVALKLDGVAVRPVTTGTVTVQVTAEPVPEVNVKTTLGEVEPPATTVALLGLHAVVNAVAAAVTVSVKVTAG